MFNFLEIKDKNDYFKPQNQRAAKGVYCYHWIGFDDETLLFFRKIQSASQTYGTYFKKNFSNPTESEVNYFYEQTGHVFLMEKKAILQNVKQWIPLTNQEKIQLLADSIYEMLLLLQGKGMNVNILKNAFIKFMCWSRYLFDGILPYLGENTLPKILYEGEISKYEIYMLWILAKAGCDVIIVNFENEDAYLKIDSESVFSKAAYGKRRGIPPIHFSKIDLTAIEQAEKQKEEIKRVESSIITNSWMTGDALEEAEKTNTQRNYLAAPKICNLFVRYRGIDQKEEYENRLFRFRAKMEKKRPVLVLEQRIGNPTMDEVKKSKPFSYTAKQQMLEQMAMEIQVSADKTINTLVKRAFLTVMEGIETAGLPQLYNHGVRFLCWLRRYQEFLFSRFQIEQIPIVLYYGECSQGEAVFLTMLSYMPIDILCFCPDKTGADPFISIKTAKNAVLIEMPNSMKLSEFPKTEKKIKVATTAYEAERDLDQMLYHGTGLYRNRQFTRSTPVTLKTTYDEIAILWKEESKYRPNFLVEENRVMVPNLFVKICGVEERTEGEYFKKIREMVTEETIVITRIPFIPDNAINPIRQEAAHFMKQGKIQPEKIKSHQKYAYDYLNEDTQAYILEKIQELIDLNWIKCNTTNLNEVILSTLLSLDKKTIRLIQQFDFTGEIPKVLIVDVDETMMSLADCIYLTFLNLIGFDIAVFTPTGYRNIEKYIKEDAYEEFQVGKYMFHLSLPSLNPIRSLENGGLFNKLFGKGRK